MMPTVVLPPGGVRRHHAPSTGVAVPVARPSTPPVDWSGVISTMFFVSAGVYAVATAVLLLPWVRPAFPDLMTREGAFTHLGMTVAATGLCLVAGFGYRLPSGQGRLLWSVPLAWLHVLLLHGAYLVTAAGFLLYHAAQGPEWWTYLGWGAAASAAGLAAMAGNLVASLVEHDTL